MVNLIVELSKYLMIILFAAYTYECFSVLGKGKTAYHQQKIFKKMNSFMFLIHLDAFAVIYAVTKELNILIFYVAQVILLVLILNCYRIFYPKASRLVVNNMCMLLTVGLIILTRLSEAKAIKQFVIAAVASLITMIIPFVMHKVKFLSKLTWFYAVVGIVMLGLVAVAGTTSYGAKISFTIAGITIQPSEFIKIIFVFYVASMLYQSLKFKQILITTVVAAIQVLILVASKDLGGALIFFIVYLSMLYVATRKVTYFIGGLFSGSLAAIVAYKLFNHVRVRVLAWKAPLSVIDNEGYQICQSLFAIGTGGFFGLGLYQGMPDKIPVVEQDFVFAAISEELGGIFALCLILVCISCFLMFFNIAMQMKNQFYKLIALGLGTVYGFQVFLTIGGVIKFIPSTGVTLPLVSYGGSSLLGTFILFSIIQGLYILREDEGDVHDKKTKQSGKENSKSKKTGFDTHFEELE